MPTQLDQILAHTLLEVSQRKAAAALPELERRAVAHRPRGFAQHLRAAGRADVAVGAKPRPAVIAEIKKASPSRGLIRADFRPAELARSLEEAGAAALSVLTDAEFFGGSLENLETASAHVAIPCLRKDFVLDPFQVLEARAAGADAVLLIVAALSDEQLGSLHAFARDLELDVLVEAHDAEEIERAMDAGAEIIGVNSRDLRTFAVSSERLLELCDLLPDDVLRVAESGIRTADDIEQLRSGGYQAFLVGEALMRQPEPAAALALLLDRHYSSEV